MVAEGTLDPTNVPLKASPKEHILLEASGTLQPRLALEISLVLPHANHAGCGCQVQTDAEGVSTEMEVQRARARLFQGVPSATPHCVSTSAAFVHTVGQAAKGMLAIVPRTKAILQAKNITFTYPTPEEKALGPSCKTRSGKPTLEDVSVQVSQASRIACIGPNGAGKSTL